MSKLRWRFRQIVWLSQKNLNFKRNTTIAKNIILSSTICSFLLQWKLQSLFQTGLKDIPCHRLATKESQKCKSCVYLMVTILFKATQGHRFSPTIEKSELFLNQIIIPKTGNFWFLRQFVHFLWGKSSKQTNAYFSILRTYCPKSIKWT